MTPDKPKPGQESVWDYPRPPRLELSSKHIRVLFHAELVAESRSAYRLLETSHPPGWYIPPGDVRLNWLEKTSKSSFCEWKGSASYWSVRVNEHTAANAAWSYATPASAFNAIKDYFAFYPSVFECYVGDERVVAQSGGFYGGWITSDVAGPFKGIPGSWGW